MVVPGVRFGTADEYVLYGASIKATATLSERLALQLFGAVVFARCLPTYLGTLSTADPTPVSYLPRVLCKLHLRQRQRWTGREVDGRWLMPVCQTQHKSRG